MLLAGLWLTIDLVFVAAPMMHGGFIGVRELSGHRSDSPFMAASYRGLRPVDFPNRPLTKPPFFNYDIMVLPGEGKVKVKGIRFSWSVPAPKRAASDPLPVERIIPGRPMLVARSSGQRSAPPDHVMAAPVPVPPPLAMLGAGLLAIAGVAACCRQRPTA